MENQPSDSSTALWRRKLSDTERAGLSSQPELTIEARLTEALARMPDVALASNFTARVLAAVELEEAQAARRRGRRWNWRSLLPRLAAATVVLVFAGISLQWHAAHSQRIVLAKNVARVAAQPAPSVEALDNFEAIRHMSQRADDQLLALLQ